MEEERIFRYKSQSCWCRASALREMLREGRRDRVEEHLWGSLVGAVKAVAIRRGRVLGSDEDIKVYVAGLAQETRNRRIGDAFNQLSRLPDAYYTIQDTRHTRDRLYQLAQRVSYAAERLWEMVPPDEEAEDGPPV